MVNIIEFLLENAVKLPQGWLYREGIVRSHDTVWWATHGGEEACELDLFEVAAEQHLFIEYGGDWETAEEQEWETEIRQRYW